MGQESRKLPQRRRQRTVGGLTQLTSWMANNTVQNNRNHLNRNTASGLSGSQMRNNAALVGGSRLKPRHEVAGIKNHRFCQFNGAIDLQSSDESSIHHDKFTSDSLIDSAEVNKGKRNQGNKWQPEHRLPELETKAQEDQQIIIPKFLSLHGPLKLALNPTPRTKQQLVKPLELRPPRKHQNYLPLPQTKKCSQQDQKHSKQKKDCFFREFFDPISADAMYNCNASSGATGDNSERPSSDQHQLSPKEILIFEPTAATNRKIDSLLKLQNDFMQLSDEWTAVCGSSLCGSPIFTEKDETDCKYKANCNTNRDGSRDFADQMLQFSHRSLSEPQMPQLLAPQQLSQTSAFESEYLGSPATWSLKPPADKEPDQQFSQPSTQSLPESEAVPLINSSLSYQSSHRSLSEPLQPQSLAPQQLSQTSILDSESLKSRATMSLKSPVDKQPDQQLSQPSNQSPPESKAVKLGNSSMSYHKLSQPLPSQSPSDPLPRPQSLFCQTNNSPEKNMLTTVKETPACDDVNSLESDCLTVKRSERHIVNGQVSFQKSQEQLCTSSSNCCGVKSSEASPDVSLSLVSGVSSLRRPGSLPCINIDGLTGKTKRRSARDDFKKEDLGDQRDISEPRSGKKRVSFSSACISTVNRTTGGRLPSACTSTSLLSMVTNPEDFTWDHTEADISELDSDANLNELPVNQNANLKANSSVATISVASLPNAAPPPVPPHAIGSKIQLESCVKEKTAHIFEATLTSSLAEQTNEKLGADRTHIQHTADTLSFSDDSSYSWTALATNKAYKAVEDSDSPVHSSNISLPTACNWTSVADSLSPNVTGAVQKQAWIESSSAGSGLTLEAPETGKRLIEVTVRQLKPQNNSGYFQSSTDTVTMSSQLENQISGSNCGNSSIGLRRHVDVNQNGYCHGHHKTRPHRQATSAMTLGRDAANASVWSDAQAFRQSSTSPTQSNRNKGSYVVFNHPPEVSTATNTTKYYASVPGSSSRVSGTRLDEQPEDCSESIGFTWVTTLDKDSHAVDMPKPLNGITPSLKGAMSSRRNNSAGCTQDYCHTGKVKFNQLTTMEDFLTSIKTAAPTSARIADVSSRDSILKPAAVRDLATKSLKAKRVTRSDSNEQPCSSEFSESDSDHPFLMLETIACENKDHKHCKSSISCRSYTPPKLWAESRATATATSVPMNFGLGTSSTYLQPAASRLPNASPPPLQPPPPAPCAKSRSSATSIAPMHANSQVSAAADAVRDLLARACDDPVEATCLTQALVRGLVCNVESLRSALAATLLLLKDRRSATGPLAQAIGTAKALDELIREFQNSQEQPQQPKQKQTQTNQRKKRRSTTTSDTDKSSILEEAFEKNAQHVNKTHPQSSAARYKRINSLTRCSAAFHEAIQCHAMAHYTVGDDFVVPTLEQRPNLECRPATTRVVRTESKAVNLAGDRVCR